MMNIVQLTHKSIPLGMMLLCVGGFAQEAPLNEPVKSLEEIQAWASTAVVEINTYDYLNYKSQLQATSGYFTANGWKAYLQDIAVSRDIEQIIQKKSVVTCVPAGEAVVPDEGVLNRKYTWRVTMPVIVKEHGSDGKKERALQVTVLIQRELLSNNPHGVGIVYYRAKS